MPLHLEPRGEVLVLRPVGDLDIVAMSGFEQAVGRALSEGRLRHLWDLGGVALLPSTMAGFLVGAGRRVAGAGGRMALCRVPPRARTTLDTMGVLELFVVFDTLDAGLADLAS